MPTLHAFTFISLNGFYKDADHSINWHQHSEEGNVYSAKSLESNNILLFGRKTYEMMASFWPTQDAIEMDSATARGMNEAEKLVVSSTLTSAEWQNTRVLGPDFIQELKMLKEDGTKNITILGSGNILKQVAEAKLLDKLTLLIDPLLLSNGTPLFEGISENLCLQLTHQQTFKNGTLLLDYDIL